MVYRLSPLAGLEPGTSSFTKVNPYFSPPHEAIPQSPSTHMCTLVSKKVNIPFNDL
jgi:hypothetical protein